MPFLSNCYSNNSTAASSTTPPPNCFKSSSANEISNSVSDIKGSTINATLDDASPHGLANNSNTYNYDDSITIIHFNDCYNVQRNQQSGGAASFLTAINQHRHLNPLILFSGDIISPSFISTFTKGEQMIPVLNDIGVHCAVFGNHEFDFGVDNLIQFVKKTSFPWLLSNVIDKETSNQLGDGKIYHIIERGGLKFGLIGLIEEEWLSTLSTLDSSDVIYEDFVTKGRELSKMLKSDPHNVDYVIALTHFRRPNDIRLADSVPEIDLILGGHDHDYDIIERPNCYVIKSGTDFREFSIITLKVNPNYVESKQGNSNNRNSSEKIKAVSDLSIKRIECINYPPDKNLEMKLDKFVSSIDEKMEQVLGQFHCDLDGRFAMIRNYETNLGNFVTDIMLASTHADLAILNSGTLRSDRIHPKGDFTMRDLYNILGYIDPIAVLNASGEQIWKALENGVSQWPKLEGRFPQVSGCSFTFDPSKPPMQRIDPSSISIGDETIQLDKQYRLTTKDYLASGKDGYDMLKDCEVILPGDESPDLTTSILNHFEAINIVKSNRRTHHRQSIICLSRTYLKKMMDQSAVREEEQVTTKRDDETSLDTANTTPNKTDHSANVSKRLAFDSNNNDDIKVAESQAASDVVTGTVGDEPKYLEKPSQSITKSFDDGPVRSSAKTGASLGSFRGSVDVGEQGRIADNLPAVPASKRTKLKMISLDEVEHEQCKLNPQVEGRIRIVGVNAV